MMTPSPIPAWIAASQASPMTPEEASYRASRAVEAANWQQILGPSCWLGFLIVVGLLVFYVWLCRENVDDGL